MKIIASIALLGSALLLNSCGKNSAPDAQPFKSATTEVSLGPVSSSDQSFSYWMNGWRKSKEDLRPKILAIQGKNYQFNLNLTDLSASGFSLFKPNTPPRKEPLPPAKALIELETNGTVYRANISDWSARLWEAGNIVQHYDFHDLKFKDSQGNPLGCKGSLNLVAWPDSLTLTTTLSPNFVYQDGPSYGVHGNGYCISEKPLDIPHSKEIDPEHFSLELWVRIDENDIDSGRWLFCKNHHEHGKGNFGFYFINHDIHACLNNLGGGANMKAIRGLNKAFKPNAWNHLVSTYDSKTFSFFINGKLQGSQKIDQQRIPGTGVITVGNRADKAGNLTRGFYDEIRIWNRALTAEEIQKNFSNPETIKNKEGLVFERNFDSETERVFSLPSWKDSKVRIQLVGVDLDAKVEKSIPEEWKLGEEKKISLTYLPTQKPIPNPNTSVTVQSGATQSFPVVFDPGKNALVASVQNLKRDFKTGYTDIRNYDDFQITVTNSGSEEEKIPFLLDLRDPANITGLCPILCDPEGRPTGIPVQLSKNWHHPSMGAYLMAYSLLPAKPGKTEYKLRIAYGFYGTLPSASHSQLSLVGYGGNGRWDQLAIGCWGETICFDMDMSCVPVAVTDVRMLMARAGREGQMWSWTDAGWGGDWLGLKDAAGNKLAFNDLKTNYIAQGPCLTDVRYDGYYGPNREVKLNAQAQTLRTDDYARTFQKLHYRFEKNTKAEGHWFYKMGGTSGYITPRIAYGNAGGLISEQSPPPSLEPGKLFLDKVSLEGKAPWWISFPDARILESKGGNGYRALVIRSYKGTFGGKTYSTPTFSAPVNKVSKDGQGLDLDALLVAPREITEFKAGDEVEMDLEWITLHRVAEDYYGPNESYRQHLTENPGSWKTTYREAIGNDLKVEVQGGMLLHRYPIVIQAKKQKIEFSIEGGVGYVPICFEGVVSPKGYAIYEVIDGKEIKLDQSVHGNDFWQVDEDLKPNHYRFSYNLPLDNKKSSHWIFKKE